MSLREKIILVIAGLSLIWGIWELGIKNMTGDNTSVSQVPETDSQIEQELTKFTTETAQKVASVNLSSKEKFIISKSTEKWNKDPFISFSQLETIKNRGQSEKDEGPSPEALFTYLGYIQINQTRLAVINDVEYKINEKIEDTRYILKEILPAYVTLSDGSKNIVIYNEETKTKVEK
ncbi:MAG: hypothetical protein ACQEQS_07070 [Thermodesulfobacteriota bacterium]